MRAYNFVCVHVRACMCVHACVCRKDVRTYVYVSACSCVLLIHDMHRRFITERVSVYIAQANVANKALTSFYENLSTYFTWMLYTAATRQQHCWSPL